MVALALAALHIGGHAFVLFWLIAAIAVHWEWQRLIGGDRQFLRFLLGITALIFAAFFTFRESADIAILVIAGTSIGLAYAAGEGHRQWAGAGLFYAGALLIPVVALFISFPFGKRAIIWLFAVVWGTDIFAYLAGRLMGGPKFWLHVSPSKTWSGTLCGVFGGAALATFVLHMAEARTGLVNPAPVAVLFILGLIVACASQGGDLFESWIKRRFGVKDSSHLIPGHGGVMDRLDGFIAASTAAVLIGALHGLPSAAEGLFHWT
jgi:phosphatidate cytidylyltransferase